MFKCSFVKKKPKSQIKCLRPPNKWKKKLAMKTIKQEIINQAKNVFR